MQPAAGHQRFIEHVDELRRRLSVSVAILVVVAAVSYGFHNQLIWFIQHPLGQPLFYTSPSGSFQFIMLISLCAGAVVALPIVLYNILRFIEPAFGKTDRLRRRRLLSIIIMSFLLAIGGVGFDYLIVLPSALHFFASFNNDQLHALISTTEYLTFAAGSMLTFAAIFQLPLIMLSINKIRNFPPGSLTRYRRHVFVGSFAVALILPFTYDPLTQFLLAVPIVILFEASIIAVWLANRSNYRAQSAAEHLPKLETELDSQRPPRPPVVNREEVLAHQPISPLPLDRTRVVQLG